MFHSSPQTPQSLRDCEDPVCQVVTSSFILKDHFVRDPSGFNFNCILLLVRLMSTARVCLWHPSVTWLGFIHNWVITSCCTSGLFVQPGRVGLPWHVWTIINHATILPPLRLYTLQIFFVSVLWVLIVVESNFHYYIIKEGTWTETCFDVTMLGIDLKP
jgi:hypothetical protein